MALTNETVGDKSNEDDHKKEIPRVNHLLMVYNEEKKKHYIALHCITLGPKKSTY